MRVLHVTSHLNIGGITTYILTLSRLLVARGHQCRITSGGGQLAEEARAAGIEHWPADLHTSADFSLHVWRASQQLAARLRREPVDLLHAHTRVGQVVAHQLARRLGVPFVSTWHGIYRLNLGRRLWPCLGDLTIAISAPVREHLIRTFRVPPARIRLVWNGVDPERFAVPPDAEALQAFRRQWGLPPGHPVVGFIGRLAGGRVKGIDLLLAAAQHLAERMPELHVLIVGDGPQGSLLRREVERRGLAGRVHMVGAATDVRVPLALMDVFVFPARWPEGFGLSLLEAMAAGKPVVAHCIGAVPDIVEDGASGCLVTPEDVPAMAGAILRLLQDGEAATRLGQAAQRRAREVFSLGRMVDQVEAVYRELVPER
jgi:glycosyltransferase involved in cell wall biosynthesis